MTTPHSTSQTQSHRAPGDLRPSESSVIPVLSSTHLLGSMGEAVIEHVGQFYRLRRTDRGGLVLTK